jgi:hypothetical protein
VRTFCKILSVLVMLLMLGFALLAADLARWIVRLSMEGQMHERGAGILVDVVEVIRLVGPWGLVLFLGLAGCGFLFVVHLALRRVDPK